MHHDQLRARSTPWSYSLTPDIKQRGRQNTIQHSANGAIGHFGTGNKRLRTDAPWSVGLGRQEAER